MMYIFISNLLTKGIWVNAADLVVIQRQSRDLAVLKR